MYVGTFVGSKKKRPTFSEAPEVTDFDPKSRLSLRYSFITLVILKANVSFLHRA